jgi:hypothetical protein
MTPRSDVDGRMPSAIASGVATAARSTAPVAAAATLRSEVLENLIVGIGGPSWPDVRAAVRRTG